MSAEECHLAHDASCQYCVEGGDAGERKFPPQKAPEYEAFEIDPGLAVITYGTLLRTMGAMCINFCPMCGRRLSEGDAL